MGEPILSASLILLAQHSDDTYKILLLKRKKTMSYASAHVFPGGVQDPSDDLESWRSLVDAQPFILPQTPISKQAELNSLKITAIRETFEEAGIFIGSGFLGTAEPGDLLSICKRRKARLELDRLHFVSRMLSPMYVRKRHDTAFFVAVVAEDLECRINEESEKAEWLKPLDVLNEFEQGNMILYPPQLHLIVQLCHHPTLSEVQAVLPLAKYDPIIGSMKSTDRGMAVCLPGDEAHDFESAVPKGPGSRNRLYFSDEPGVDFELTPGANVLIDASRWLLVKRNKMWTLVSKSKL